MFFNFIFVNTLHLWLSNHYHSCHIFPLPVFNAVMLSVSILPSLMSRRGLSTRESLTEITWSISVFRLSWMILIRAWQMPIESWTGYRKAAHSFWYVIYKVKTGFLKVGSFSLFCLLLCWFCLICWTLPVCHNNSDA